MVPGILWIEDLLLRVVNDRSSSMSSCHRLQVFTVWLGEIESVVAQEVGFINSALHSSGC